MTLKELLEKVTFKEFTKKLKEIYPKQYKTSIEGYKEVIEKLKELDPKETIMKVKIAEVYNSFCDEKYMDVFGVNKEKTYALEFMSWNKWLNMEIINEDDLDNDELLTYILYEMTFAGFQKEEIENKKQDFKKTIDKIKERE